jgi:hypothetical protein
VLGANELKKRLSLQTKDAANDKASLKKVPAQSLDSKADEFNVRQKTPALSPVTLAYAWPSFTLSKSRTYRVWPPTK